MDKQLVTSIEIEKLEFIKNYFNNPENYEVEEFGDFLYFYYIKPTS